VRSVIWSRFTVAHWKERGSGSRYTVLLCSYAQIPQSLCLVESGHSLLQFLQSTQHW
jgi:hypothetical protein